MTPTPTDWALFRKKLPGWQKAYMEQLLQQYMNILKCDRSPEDKFWTLEKRIRRDKKKTAVLLEDMSRSMMISHIIELLKDRNPLSLKLVTLLDKPDRRVTELKADYTLFTIPDYFVIGYGLDYGEYYRNLPYIAEFNAE